MDFQDILFLLIFFIFSILPKKKKTYVLDEDLDDQTDVVRKKIEALKRKRNKTGLDNETHAEIIKQNTCLDNKRKEFSAYKHSLPVYTPPIYECESQAIAQKPIFSQTKISKPKCVPHTLREGMKWHIILSKPVCTRSFYGNFTHR